MSTEAVTTLVHAFISYHMDYCNSLFYGIALVSDEPVAVCPECGCIVWCRALDVTTASTSVDFKMATLVNLSLSGMYFSCIQP